MPRLAQNLALRYPATASLLAELWRLPSRSATKFTSYVKLTGLSEEKARMSLLRTGKILARADQVAWRSLPHIELSRKIGGYSQYPSAGDLILLNHLFADQYEALMEIDPATGHGPHGPYLGGPRTPQPIAWYQYRARFLMESKVLHEMVHWARTYVTFLQDWTGPNDPGFQFERRAYGFDLTATSLGLRRFINLPGQY